MLKKIFMVIAVAMVLVAYGSIRFDAQASAGGVVTLMTGGSAISADNSVGPVYTTLTGPVLTATSVGDFVAGQQITLAAPNGFAFRTANVTVTPTNEINLGAGSGVAITILPTSTAIAINIIAGNTSTSGASVSFSGIQVYPTAGTPLASGYVVASFSAGSFTSPYNVGLLTEVPGIANKLGFTTQPKVNVLVNAVISPSPVVAMQDQFGNTRTSDAGTISISAVQAGNLTLAASGILSGNLNVGAVSGSAVFSNLSYNIVDHIRLKATFASLSPSYSNQIYVYSYTPSPTPNPTPTPGINLHNGQLVQVSGNSTVYMVVNGILRPFTSQALFNSHGKKFSDITIISASDFANYTVGAPVGHPAGTAIKASGQTVYLVTPTGGVQGIPSMAVLNRLRIQTRSIIQVTDGELNGYPFEGVAN